MRDGQADGRLAAGVVELRQYTLHPGMRETLIELFEREFVESQEACGMSVIGQFRDLDRPDRFVWMRGFADMEARPKALAAFYEGPVWAAHRDAANATMIEFDDVLLLKPAGGELELDPSQRPVSASDEMPVGLLTATIIPLAEGAEGEFAELFDMEMRPRLEEAGGSVLATFVTEKAVNNFAPLPVRADANVFVWLGAFDDEAGYRAYVDAFAGSAGRQARGPAAAALSAGAPDVLRLQPTARSLLRGGGSTSRR